MANATLAQIVFKRWWGRWDRWEDQREGKKYEEWEINDESM